MTDSIPNPTGWTMIIKTKETKEKTKGGILLPQETQDLMESAECVGQVIKQGPDCYRNPKFNGQRWCEVGDWVLFPRHVGMNIDIVDESGNSIRYRLINDYEVKARLDNPSAIRTYVAQ